MTEILFTGTLNKNQNKNRIKFQFLKDSTDFKKPCERKPKILLLTYAKFAYMQNLRICKSLPCVQGFRIHNI